MMASAPSSVVKTFQIAVNIFVWKEEWGRIAVGSATFQTQGPFVSKYVTETLKQRQMYDKERGLALPPPGG